MKTALVCAIIFGQFAAQGREPAPAGAQRQVGSCASVTVVTTRTGIVPPAPVAEMTTGNGPTLEGVFLRVATAPRPIQMLNPLAPPEYGSAGNLVSYTDFDPNRTANPNKQPLQPQANGIRLLTLRPLW